MCELILPFINNLTGKELGIHYNQIQFTLGLLAIVLFTGIASGSYPSFFISSFSTHLVLKGNVKSGSSLFRKILVIFQFSLALILIIGTFVISDQLNFLQTRNLGLNKDQILYTEFTGSLSRNYRLFKYDLKNLPEVINVTYCSDLPTYTVHSTWGVSWEGKSSDEQFLIHQFAVDEDYLSTFGIGIKDGRNFDFSYPTDSGSFILNETAVRLMELKDPVGKWFSLWDNKNTIIGIMNDFNFKSLHKPVEPLIFRINRDPFGYIFIKVRAGDTDHSIAAINRVWEKYNPEFPMNLKFLDSEYEKLYKAETKMSVLFQSFAMVAIFLSCLGLFGLASFMTEARTREIGIRKAMGASSFSIIRMLSVDFSSWVLISMVIGLPAAYLYLHHWLENFAYRTHLHFSSFLLACILVLVISQVSVIYQTWKASGKDPADILKYE
jgi:ABC-type antimicrobial peptide transport system permease subunit